MSTEAIDHIMKRALAAIDDSKLQIYEITQHARHEVEALNEELFAIIEETKAAIDKVDQLEIDYRKSRIRLVEVSRDFQRYTEIDIKEAYEEATRIQLELSRFREKETYLKERRDELHQRIKNLTQTVERAELLGVQMNVVQEYLSGDMNQVTQIIESAKNRHFMGLRIILAQEEERKRMSREIHDGVAQSMANVVLRMEIADRMITKKNYDAVGEELQDIKKQLRESLEDVRKLIFNLRPMALDDLGLVPTIRKYIQDFEDRHKIHTNFEVVGKERRLASGLEVALFRIIQEALTNAQKHAQASYIEVAIVLDPKEVSAEIRDNGIGFDTEQTEKKISKTGHYGLIGMKERVELIQGNVTIESNIHVGTTIRVVIPTGQRQEEE